MRSGSGPAQTLANMLRLSALLAVLLLSLLVVGKAYAGVSSPNEVRLGRAISKFDDTSLVALVYRLPAPRWTYASYFDFALGGINSDGQTHAKLMLGPVWRFALPGDRSAIKLGFSPTLLSLATYDDRDMGGHLHFTSSIAYELLLSRRLDLALSVRLQHTSNGGLNSDNPGMDTINMSLAWGYGA